MEPRSHSPRDPQDVVSKIDQKALRLSALLRDIDNHPVEMDPGLKERLDEILELLACRVAATRALLQQTPPLAREAVSTG
ncbi:MAG: hypothetical protein ABR564_01895 [Candidatus Dormibacteria bacterium]